MILAVVFFTNLRDLDAEDFGFVEFPPYTDGCRKVDGGDGSHGSLEGCPKKAANTKLPKTHTAAYTAFSKMSSVLRISAKWLRW